MATLGPLTAISSLKIFQTMRLIVFLAVAGFADPSLGFAPSSLSQCPTVVGAGSSTRLHASDPEPLATEGDWSAYLDAETTGYVYYFNAVSGESKWEKPTATFPEVSASTAAVSTTTSASSGEERREARRKERRRQREEQRREREKEREEQRREKEKEKEKGGGGGFFGALFGGGKPERTVEPAKTKKEQLSELSEIANNDNFLSELDSVIAEAEEAIAIAEKVEEAPPQNKGGFFSDFGFVSGTEAIEEAETLIGDAEKRTGNIFSQFGSGASPKAEEKPEAEEKKPETEAKKEPEENPWIEGLVGLFKKSFEAFIPPETKETPAKKVVAVDAAPKEKKAEVSGSDFLDVVWGAETSARPTLNIAEMMKAFKVETKDDEKSAATEEESEEFRTVALDVALSVKAHPEKASWGGEDAGFVVGRTFGVFDGVSGAEKERGKKLYSRSLADSMKRSSARGGMSVKEITDKMTEAKELADEVATGASTAVVASIGEDNVLRALNLGDSVCLVLRDGAVAARTREIIHYFDCPYQLGYDSPDRPRDGTSLQTEVFRGDVVVAGSDGVFDNLSDRDVCEIVGSFGPRAKSGAIAQKIVDRSRSVSLDPDAVTPYSTVARGKRGYERYRSGRGGKVDDISCVVVKAS